MSNYQKICDGVIDVAAQAANFINSKRGEVEADVIQSKGTNDFVSFVDKTAEKQIVEALEKILPEAGFIAEEGTSTKKGEKFNWIIDPLDGTTNFLHSLPPFCVSIALMEDDEVVLGVVHEVTLKESFYAWKEGGAFLNGEKIEVSTANKVKDSLVATGFPYYDFKYLKGFMKSLEFFFTKTHGVRRLGSAAADLAYVACGRFESFYEYNLKPWDVAAGVILIKEAGGEITDFEGGSDYTFGEQIVASNKHIHKEFLSQIQGFLSKEGLKNVQ